MFEDNEYLILNSMNFHTKLYKRHNTLFFHRVTESIVAGVCIFYLPGELNLADGISKHWSHSDIWKLLRPILCSEMEILQAYIWIRIIKIKINNIGTPRI